MRRTSLALLTMVTGLGSWGCATTPSAPRDWLASPEELQRDYRGGWIEVDYVDADLTRLQLDGELLAIDDERLHVAVPGGMKSVALDSVATARLTAYDANSGAVAGLVAGGTLLTISNGVLLVFTAPMWIIGGSIATGHRSREPILNQPSNSWDEFRLYARFPQGLPPDFENVPMPTPEVVAEARKEPEGSSVAAPLPHRASSTAYWFEVAVGPGFNPDDTGIAWLLGANVAYRWFMVGTRLSIVQRSSDYSSYYYDDGGETFDLALLLGLRGSYGSVRAAISAGPAAYALNIGDLTDFDGSFAAQGEIFTFPWRSLGLGVVGAINWNSDFQDFYVIAFGIAFGSP